MADPALEAWVEEGDGSALPPQDVKLLQAYTTARLQEYEQRIEAEIEDEGLAAGVVNTERTSVRLPEEARPAANNRTLELRVSGLGGALCSVVVDPALRVRDVKSKVAAVTLTPIDQQKLFLGSCELRDQDLVMDVTPPASPVAEVSMVRVDPEWQRCLEMVSIAGMQLAVVPPHLRTDREIVLASVRQNGASLQYAAEELKGDREVVMAAVQDQGLALEFAVAGLQEDRDVVLAAVLQSGKALQHASLHLRADRELVFAAVRGNSEAFRYAGEDLRADREYVLTIVEEAGLALEFADLGCRSDRDIVATAVRQDGLALEYATEELRAERSIVLEAVRMNGLALWDAAEDLKHDPEIVAAAKWG